MFVVIFTSIRSEKDVEGYERMAHRMVEKAKSYDGFVAVTSFRDTDGKGVTLSYWASLEALQTFKLDLEHLLAQSKGKSDWYKQYSVEVCEVKYAYQYP